MVKSSVIEEEAETEAPLTSYSFPELGVTVEGKDLADATAKARKLSEKPSIS